MALLLTATLLLLRRKQEAALPHSLIQVSLETPVCSAFGSGLHNQGSDGALIRQKHPPAFRQENVGDMSMNRSSSNVSKHHPGPQFDYTTAPVNVGFSKWWRVL